MAYSNDINKYHNKDIGTFIEIFKGSEDATRNIIETMYIRGMCGNFAIILHKAFPGGDIVIMNEASHVMYRYENFYYDIVCEFNDFYLYDEDTDITYPEPDKIIATHNMELLEEYMNNFNPEDLT